MKIQLNFKPSHCYWATFIAFLGLFFLLMLWHTVLFPSSHFPIALILLINVMPLLFPLQGFLKGRRQSCAWIAYLSLFYFIQGVMEAYTKNNVEHWLGLLEVFFSLMLFFSAALYVRTRNNSFPYV